ncbi:hypothetical protein CQW49_09020 [Methylosinus trichosporium OB3b]|uniref:Uncharacterized protein n=1 Tax=Methylosinus trichosporium (strain ATCC 35070 / NCIMB 11131 / UNIQEM 75 / OB3b) TaxID=595536 RepID=A0A2D2CZ42_METT3|nr:hypothetical protein CQW49_09020 [Methylosinus trichosporium OB3b]
MAIVRQEESGGVARRDKILAPPPFCQDPREMSGGISQWPTPGLRRRRRPSPPSASVPLPPDSRK